MELKFDVQDLSCGYRDAVVLEDISFSLIDGDVLCILGPNGVGKTTLFKTILGLLPRLGGKILCDDQVIDDGHECTNKSWIAYVPQAHRPAFAFTVFDIVLMGRTSHLKAFATPSDKDRAITRDVLSELGLMDLAERPYTQISGGERQLVLIARALVQQPQILVMDEPAASLDFGNQATMLQHVRNLAYKKGLVVLMTSHNPDHAILVANKTLLIEGRAKTLFGDTNQVVSDSTLSSLYHTPIRILEGMSCQDQKQRSCCFMSLGYPPKLITISGPPSSGKTSIVLKTSKLLAKDHHFGVVKFDCLSGSDADTYRHAGIAAQSGISGALCPDHFFATNIGACLDWAQRKGFDLLVSESAGLCNRCSPHLKESIAVCVIDIISGVDAPRKIGPMLRMADVIVITKSDMVSQAEREVFALYTVRANPRALVLFANGLTGQGILALHQAIEERLSNQKDAPSRLRFPMPAAACSYCFGETKIGERYSTGNIKYMKIDD